MIRTYTKEEFIKEYSDYGEYKVYTRVEDVPKHIKDIIYEKSEIDEIIYDYLEPLEKGLDWLFEYTYKYQPKTGKVLKEAKNLFMIVKEFEVYGIKMIRANLLCELNGKILMIARQTYKNNICDDPILTEELKSKTVNPKLRSTPFEFALKKELIWAYYYRFSGFGFPRHKYFFLRTTPLTDVGILSSVDSLLEEYGYRKKDRNKYLNYLQKVLDKEWGEGYDVQYLCSFMNTWYYFTGREDEKINKNDYAFFMHIQKNYGDIYVIKNGDVVNIKKLKNPVEVIDEYVAQVLTTQSSDFDFEPYLEEIKDKPEFIDEEIKGYEVEKITVSNLDINKINEILDVIDIVSAGSYVYSQRFYRIKTDYGIIKENKKEMIHWEYIDLKELIKIEKVEKIELVGYSRRTAYDYKDVPGDEEIYDFAVYMKYNVVKGKLEIVIPTKFNRNFEIDELEEIFKEHKVENIKIKRKVLEDERYENYYKKKVCDSGFDYIK